MLPAHVGSQERPQLDALVKANAAGVCEVRSNQRMTAAEFAEAKKWTGVADDAVGFVGPEIATQQAQVPMPRWALESGSEGAVSVLIYISEDGSVMDVRALCASNRFFIPDALEAVRHNTYRPATLAGKAVRSLAFQNVVFDPML